LQLVRIPLFLFGAGMTPPARMAVLGVGFLTDGTMFSSGPAWRYRRFTLSLPPVIELTALSGCLRAIRKLWIFFFQGALIGRYAIFDFKTSTLLSLPPPMLREAFSPHVLFLLEFMIRLCPRVGERKRIPPSPVTYPSSLAQPLLLLATHCLLFGSIHVDGSPAARGIFCSCSPGNAYALSLSSPLCLFLCLPCT